MEHVEHLLGAYHDGELPERVRKGVERHVQECARCRLALNRMQALSRTLCAYTVPDLDRGAERFCAQVVLRLGRRRPVGAPSVWLYLVPAILSGAIAGLLALWTLPQMLGAVWALLHRLGVDPSLVLQLWNGTQLPREALAMLRAIGTLAWRAALYAALLLLFGAYAGWVGVLWRTEVEERSGKER